MEYTAYPVGAPQITLDSYIQEGFGRYVHLVYKSSTLQSSMYVHSIFKAPPTAKLEIKTWSCCYLITCLNWFRHWCCAHTHGPHIRMSVLYVCLHICMSVFNVHLCATSPSCSVSDPSVTRLCKFYLVGTSLTHADHLLSATS